jgi:hypothetical protein
MLSLRLMASQKVPPNQIASGQGPRQSPSRGVTSHSVAQSAMPSNSRTALQAPAGDPCVLPKVLS